MSDWATDDEGPQRTPSGRSEHSRSRLFTKSRSRLQRSRSERQSKDQRPALGAAAALLKTNASPPLNLSKDNGRSEELWEETVATVPDGAWRLMRVKLQGHSFASHDATLAFTLHTSPFTSLPGTANQPALPAPSQGTPLPAGTAGAAGYNNPAQVQLLLSTWKTAKMKRKRACLRPQPSSAAHTSEGQQGGGLCPRSGLPRRSVWDTVRQAAALAAQAIRDIPSELAHAHPWLFERTASHVSDSHAHHYHGAVLPTSSSARLRSDLGIAMPGLGISMPGGEQAVTNWLLLWAEQGTPAPPLPGGRQAGGKQQQGASRAAAGGSGGKQQQPGQQPGQQQQLGAAAGQLPLGQQQALAGLDAQGPDGTDLLEAPMASSARTGMVGVPPALGSRPGKGSPAETSVPIPGGLRPKGAPGEAGALGKAEATAKAQRQGVISVPVGVEEAATGDNQLWQTFRDIDKDHNGVLDMAELTQALSTLGLPCSYEYLEDMMRQYDRNQDGAISFSEFKWYIKRRNADLERAFKQFDLDGNGQISAAELEQALKAANLPYVAQQAEVQRMMSMLAEEPNKGVSFAEFRRFASLLPHTQTASGSHVLYAWANSSLWRQITRPSEIDPAGQGGYADPLLLGAGGHHGTAIAAAATKISAPNEVLLRLMVGGVAGVVSRTIIAPLERLRTLMMLAKVPRGLGASAALMWADGGFAGLFKGHLSTVIKVFPTSAIQFGVVDATKKAFQAATNGGPLTELHCFVAGCLAGGVACIVSHPLDTIRTQMSAAVAGTQQRSMLQVARALGAPGLYRGFGLSCLQEVIGNGLGFWTVDKACQAFQDLNNGRAPNAQERGMMAAVCAMFVMTCVMPLDVVVRRIQAQGSPGHPVLYANALDAFRKIAATEGVGAFYRGLLTTYMKTAPSMGAVYYFYDTFGKLSGVGGLNRYRTPL